MSLPPNPHLDPLFHQKGRWSLFSSIVSNVRDLIHPTRFDPDEFTSRPADPGTMLLTPGRGLGFARSHAVSLALNVALVAGLLWLGSARSVQTNLRNVVQQNHIFAPSLQVRELTKVEGGGGGGGGQQSPEPATHGEVPVSHRQLLMPPAPRPDHPVALAIEVGMDLPLQAHEVNQVGDPLSRVMGDRGGPGQQGIGIGNKGGIGPGTGPGAGDGLPGVGGTVGGIGGATRPVAIYQPQPEYSEEARKARFQGLVMLMVTVGEDGLPRDIRVTRSLGLGLDEKAIEAVSRWRFRPAMKNGRPVATWANIEVGFRLF